jgi:hypothetical protein
MIANRIPWPDGARCAIAISVWHPAFPGRLARFKAVLEMLDYMRAKGGVWFAQLDQVCDHVHRLMSERRWTPRYEMFPLYQGPLPEFSKGKPPEADRSA